MVANSPTANLSLASELLSGNLPETVCGVGMNRGLSDKAAGRDMPHRQQVEQCG